MADEERLVRFCTGRLSMGPRRRPLVGRALRSADVTQTLSVDAWTCVAEHLCIRDRRAFAATSAHGRLLDRSAWEAQRSVHLPASIGWHDLWYVALLPLRSIVAGAEWLDDRRTTPHDLRLCVCVAARLVTQALRLRRANYLHGVQLLQRATGRPDLFHGVRDERALIASIAASAQHPAVAAAHLHRRSHGRPVAAQRRHSFFLPLERLRVIFGSTQTATWALEALPWPWLWAQLEDNFVWCGEES